MSQTLPSGAQWQDRKSWAQLKHRKFHLKLRKKVFTVRVVRYRNRFPRGYLKSPFSETVKTQPRMALGNLVWLTPL